MGRPEEDQLRLVCSQAATFTKAKILLQQAKTKTRPGSGYHIGADSVIGLPAVCAYLASQQLNNGDISQTVAQTSSCLNEKVFLKTLKTVREALFADVNQTKTTGMSYLDLNREYTGSRSSKVAGWMNDTERVLVLKEVLAPKYDSKSDLVRCAVFWWVAQIVQLKTRMSEVIKDHNLSEKQFDIVLKIINKECESVAKKIRSELEALRDPASNADPSDSLDLEKPAEAAAESSLQSRTRSGTASPSKSAMKTRTLQDSPTKSLRKRGVSFEAGSGSRTPHRTPIKKLKLTPVRETPQSRSKNAAGMAAFEAAFSGKKPEKRMLLEDDGANPFDETPTRPKRARARSPPRAMPMEVDVTSENERTPSPTPLPRRFRPVFLDRKQWASRDPRVAKEWPVMIEHVNNMVGLYGHPFAQRIDVEMQAV